LNGTGIKADDAESSALLVGAHLRDQDTIKAFERTALPHLDAAYNLARWLTRDDHDAEDLVQAAFERALKFFDGFRGGDARAWILTIVRNTFYTSLRNSRHEKQDVSFDEENHADATNEASPLCPSFGEGANPEVLLAAFDTKRAVNEALNRLPHPFKEAVVLKELEELSYKEIAEISGVPIGTVMSRLARGRKLLVEYLKRYAEGGSNEL
jgi:RNA polymerase sigma-70 factor (ECF subfamily)